MLTIFVSILLRRRFRLPLIAALGVFLMPELLFFSSNLTKIAAAALQLEPMLTAFFVTRSTIVEGPGGLPAWRCVLFSWMTRQSESAASYFRLPPNRVVELRTQVML